MPGRIPQAFLDDLLNRVDIVEVIDRRVKLKKSGKNYSARCPFHEERSPSFSVNPDKQFYYCFGCGAGGNALTFLMEYENLEFPQAVESLASGAGLIVPKDAGRDGTRQEESSKPLYALLEKVSRFYQQQLRSHPQARRAVDYLKGRGLSGEIAKQFHLGFAPPGWDTLHNGLGGGDELRELLIKTGMLVKNEDGRVYDRFRDRVMFPIRDRRGRVIAFGGRVLGDDKPKYLNSPETEIFHKGRELYGLYEARQSSRTLERTLIVEGYMDVIALAQHGITFATATLGTATSQVHLESVYRLCPEVVFSFDGDTAGRKAALRALEAALPCMADGRQAKFLFLPEGQDPDDAVRSGGKAHFEQLLGKAVPLETFLFDSVAHGLDLTTLDGRARMSKLALPYIRQLPEGVFRQLMFQELAERTGLELSSLMQLEAPPAPVELPRDFESGPDYDPPPGFDEPFAMEPDRPTPQLRPYFTHRPPAKGYSNLAQAAIALLLHQPSIARLANLDLLHDVEGDDGQLLKELLQLLHRRPESSTAMLLGHWYGTTEGKLLSRLAGQERLIPATGIEQQFVDTMTALAQLPHQSKLAEQVDKLKHTNYAEVTEVEKQRLRELLQEKLQRDSVRNKPWE